MSRRLLVLALPLAVAAACSSSSPGATLTSPAPHSAGSHSVSWPTYHRDNARSGATTSSVRTPIGAAWTKRLDGAVYGEPLVVHRRLIVATENDSVYQLDPGNGRVYWRTHLGHPATQNQIQNDQPGCGDIFPLGITGTPAYDARTGSVFVVAETRGGKHTLWALNATTGHRRWHTSTDVVPSRDRLTEQQRSALLVSSGRVFTTYGGLSGDCGNYVGYITSTATTGKGRTTHYAVPTAREAGMWSPAGPVTGPNGNIYVASGNGAEFNGKFDKSDSVTELAPKSLHRLAVFAPSTWPADNRADLDLGSSSPVPVNGRLLIAGKRGTVYLLKPSLGGIGGQLATLDGCQAFGGAARRGHLVVMPCHDGLRLLRVKGKSMRWGWRSSGTYGSPVISGRHVFVAHGPTQGLPGHISVLSLKTGRLVSSAVTGDLTHFPSQTVYGNHVYVPTLTGITAVRGS